MFVLTGATGHIGNNVARKLVDSGKQVKLLVRNADDIAVKDIEAEKITGDLDDIAFLTSVIGDGDTVIHCAGRIELNDKYAKDVYKVNVGITEKIAHICIAKKARLVYVSSTDAIAKQRGETVGAPEQFSPEKLKGCYAISKATASRMIMDYAKSGLLDAVIVCPSAVIGNYDFKPSCVGQVISDYISHKLMARINGGYNFVSVTDVAAGIIAVAESPYKAKAYLLTGEYFSVDDMFRVINKRLGFKKLPVKLPVWLIWTFADLGVLYYKMRKIKPIFTRHALSVMAEQVDFDNSLTKSELKISMMSAEKAVIEAVDWFNNKNKRH